MRIEEIDKNFKTETFEKDNMVFFNVKEPPFDLYGLYKSKKDLVFARMPENVASNISQGVCDLSKRTAGVRLRFSTDSMDVALVVKRPDVCKTNHMPLSSTSGFDMYADGEFVGIYRPPLDDAVEFDGILHLANTGMHDIIINFPLYNEITDVYVGVIKGSKLQKGGEYKNKKPVIYYGSSITQGACASRPGNCYPAMISRKFNLDYINLGFAGNAKGETSMAKYIANLDMCCFVYDYDHNAPTPEYLRKTHEPMFKIVREKHPDIPIIMMNSPYQFGFSEERRAIIMDTYKNAIENGDKNVYFIDMEKVVSVDSKDGTVDGAHPNDLGFRRMADAVIDVLKKVLM